MLDTNTISFNHSVSNGKALPIKLTGFANDHIFNTISKHQSFYELGLLNFLAKHAKKGGTYIDIGANIGNHSVFFSKFLADQVISIEPGKELKPILEKNLNDNSVKGKFYNIGCGKSNGECFLTRDRTHNNWGSGYCSSQMENNYSEKILIRSLDDLYFESNYPPISLIKIDVEGFEIEVLKGAQKILEKYKPQIVIEASTQEEKLNIMSILNPHGYLYVKQFNATPTHYLIHRKDRLRTPSFRIALNLLTQKLFT